MPDGMPWRSPAPVPARARAPAPAPGRPSPGRRAPHPHHEGQAVTASRLLLSVTLVLSAAVLQATVVNRISLPGAGPDLVLLVVIGLALVVGPTAGASIGFGAGLLV